MAEAKTHELANAIRELREKLNLPQDVFARKAGLGIQTIRKLERGISCKLDTLHAILEALEVNDTDQARIMQAWMNLEIPRASERFQIRPTKAPAPKSKPGPLDDQIANALKERPTREKELIAFLLEHPETLSWIPPIKDLYTKIKQP